MRSNSSSARGPTLFSPHSPMSSSSSCSSTVRSKAQLSLQRSRLRSSFLTSLRRSLRKERLRAPTVVPSLPFLTTSATRAVPDILACLTAALVQPLALPQLCSSSKVSPVWLSRCVSAHSPLASGVSVASPLSPLSNLTPRKASSIAI